MIEKFFKTHNITLIDKFVEYNDIPIPIPGFDENNEKLAEFVLDLPQKLYDNSKNLKGVFVFMDEFQYIKELNDVDSFLWNLRSKVQSQKMSHTYFQEAWALRIL